MQSILKRISILFLVVTTFVTPFASQAAESTIPSNKQSDQTTLPEVVVTATRSETPISKTASSISVVTSEQIEKNQYRTITDALRSIPGVQIAQTGTPTQSTTFLFRGTESRHNRILIDGRPIPEGLGGSIVNDLSTSNVERIEVLRGPASSLYGGNAIGGVVNIVTKKGKGIEKPETTLRFEAGSFNNFQEAARSRGALGLFDYSVEASRQDAEFQRANNELRESRWSGQFGYQLTPDLYFDLYTNYSLNDSGSPGADPISGFSKPGKYDNFIREIWTFAPGVTWKTSEIWTQHLSYQYQERRQHFYSPRVIFGGVTSANTSNRQQVDDHRIDYQSTIKPIDTFEIVAGLSTQDRKTYRSSDILNTTLPYQNFQTNTSAFIQTNWEILENWNLLSSGRLDHYSDFGNPMTYKVGSSYKTPLTDTVIHTNYGTAFSAPEEQNFISFGGLFIANPNLQPEDSRGYEVGITQPLFNHELELRGTYFHNNIQGLVQTRTVNPVTFQYTVANIGDARTQGYETGLTWKPKWKPINRFELDTNYTYLDAVNKNSGAWLLRRPRHTVNSTLNYQPIDSVHLGLGGSWVMNRIDSDPVSFNQIPIEDYFVMRFSADWKINNQWKLFGRIENLLDEQYAEVQGFQALDRAFYGGFEFSF